MRFTVGATVYALRIATGQLHVNGTPTQAATTDQDREILISATTEPIRRRHVLLRELMRAWEFETGTPSTPDDWRELAATMAEAAIDALQRQGGEMALLGLMPGESPQPGAAIMGVGGNRQAGCCRATVASASVMWTPTVPGAAELRAYCDHCNRTTVWTEALNVKGQPTGVVLGKPKLERGDTSGAELAAV